MWAGQRTPTQYAAFGGSTTPAAEPEPPLLQIRGKLNNVYRGGYHLNNKGYVLGLNFLKNRSLWAFIWIKETGIKYLFQLDNSLGHPKLNDHNQVLYRQTRPRLLERISRKYFPPHRISFMWDPNRGRISLDNQIPRKMGKLDSLVDINNRGEIIGTLNVGRLGKKVPVLLEPIPERRGK